MQNEIFKKFEKIKEKDSFVITLTIYNKKAKSDKKIQNYLLINELDNKELGAIQKALVKQFEKEGKKRK